MNDTTSNIGGQDADASIEEWSQAGTHGQIGARSWSRPAVQPRFLAILVHGYGEHIGRYDHVAEALIEVGAFVCGLDHLGHGKSDGERVLITDFEDVVMDVRRVLEHVREQWPELPVVMIGHSMGGLIAARYAQLHHDELTALVLSGALIGEFDLIPQLLALDEMPDVPLDPAILSRDLEVGDAYAADPLVWHGPFKRPTVEAMGVMLAAIHDGPSIHDLPLMW
ncbi:MAG: alpha/beta fold hydrolase, partial [Ilumatobacteraceae bacterium]